VLPVGPKRFTFGQKLLHWQKQALPKYGFA
jgi:hypothetical protein